MDLEQVILRLKNGEIDALEIIYNEMYVALYAFSLSILKDKDAANSILQDAFILIYQKAELYKESTNPKAWIYTIVKNLITDYLRKDNKIIYFSDINTIPNKKITDFDNIAINQLINELDEISRQIVILYVFEGFKHKEIANILNLKEGTVRWKYREALKILGEKLRGEVHG